MNVFEPNTHNNGTPITEEEMEDLSITEVLQVDEDEKSISEVLQKDQETEAEDQPQQQPKVYLYKINSYQYLHFKYGNFLDMSIH